PPRAPAARGEQPERAGGGSAQGQHPGRGGAQSCGAGRGGGAQLRPATEGHRQHARVHRTPRAAHARRAGRAVTERGVSMQLLLLTGMSGSGKSIALNALEDLGYYCVDNLPAKLLPEVVEYLRQSDHVHVAISIDVRSVETLPLLPQHILVLRHSGVDVQLVYLEASTDTLVKRYSETRRRHPLSEGELTLPEAIASERELLADIAALAHHIDTSDLRPAQLRAWV